MPIDSGLRNRAGQPITFERIQGAFGGYDYTWSCDGCGHTEPKALQMFARDSSTEHASTCAKVGATR